MLDEGLGDPLRPSDFGQLLSPVLLDRVGNPFHHAIKVQTIAPTKLVVGAKVVVVLFLVIAHGHKEREIGMVGLVFLTVAGSKQRNESNAMGGRAFRKVWLEGAVEQVVSAAWQNAVAVGLGHVVDAWVPLDTVSEKRVDE